MIVMWVLYFPMYIDYYNFFKDLVHAFVIGLKIVLNADIYSSTEVVQHSHALQVDSSYVEVMIWKNEIDLLLPFTHI